MYNKEQTSFVRKTLAGLVLLAVFLSSFGGAGFSHANAMGAAISVLSDGQFVYGPNVGDFNVTDYLAVNAPHLLEVAKDLYGRAEYYSINPKIYLTLLEMNSNLVSNPEAGRLQNPFGMVDKDFITQIEDVSKIMSDAYYLHINNYSALPISQRNLEPITTAQGDTITVAPETNAGTYAIIAGLAAMNQPDLPAMLDNEQPGGFYQTYIRLFGSDDPLDTSNHIYLPGEPGAMLPAPDGLLQAPWLRGQAWYFGGVHDSNGGGGSGTPFHDASSLDFTPGNLPWGSDTSNVWVVASASGIATRLSACGFKIVHSAGWETTYYHLENVQYYPGVAINQNDKIGVLANTLAEAICTGGGSSGPHVHFSLKHNGALVTINGTPLSGWYVHAGRNNYDTNPNYMWLEKGGVKKLPWVNPLLSEATSMPPVVLSSVRGTAGPDFTNVNFLVTFSKPVIGVDGADFSLTVSGLTGAAVTGVSGSGAAYTVTVNTGSGSGILRLDVIDNDSIIDLDGNPLGGAGSGNANFSTGEFYSINRSPGYFLLSGTTAVSDVILSYTDSTPKTVTSISGGLYAILIPSGWAGSVTPARFGYVFSPSTRNYAPVSNLTGQDFAPTLYGIPTFGDVPLSYWSWLSIEVLVKNGVTSGCSLSPRLYCPTTLVTRDQMAVFLVRAKHGPLFTPPAPSGVFADVPVDYWAASWIEQLAADGITSGCSTTPKLFCPHEVVSRDQMAVFLVRSKYGAEVVPPAATGVFTDVSKTFWAAGYIEKLAADGITSGCNLSPMQYCPGTATTRDQMAVFLVRGFNLK